MRAAAFLLLFKAEVALSSFIGGGENGAALGLAFKKKKSREAYRAWTTRAKENGKDY